MRYMRILIIAQMCAAAAIRYLGVQQQLTHASWNLSYDIRTTKAILTYLYDASTPGLASNHAAHSALSPALLNISVGFFELSFEGKRSILFKAHVNRKQEIYHYNIERQVYYNPVFSFLILSNKSSICYVVLFYASHATDLRVRNLWQNRLPGHCRRF